jgi:competence protein ComEA
MAGVCRFRTNSSGTSLRRNPLYPAEVDVSYRSSPEGGDTVQKSIASLAGLVLALNLTATGWSASPASRSVASVSAAGQANHQAKETRARKQEKLGDTVVNLNTASAAELQRLPGVGKKKADMIIKARPFSSPDELVTKKILSAKKLEKIRSHLTVQ